MNYKTIAIFGLLLQSTVLLANDLSECDYSHRWWWNIGAGIGAASNDSANYTAPALQLSFNGMITNSMFITLAWTDILKNNDYRNDESATEMGILLGYKSKRPTWYWSAAAGVGAARYEKEYVSYNRYYSYSYTQSETNISVPVEAQLFYTPFKHFGIGLIGHASVSKAPFASAMLAIQFA